MSSLFTVLAKSMVIALVPVLVAARIAVEIRRRDVAAAVARQLSMEDPHGQQ